DENGNLITIGLFEGNVDFNPDSTTLFLHNNGEKDIYVQKLNSSGNLDWAISIGGPSTEEVLFVKTDNIGNVFICGEINDTVDFDPGNAVFELGIPLNEDHSSFIAKYDPSGNLIWVKLFNECKFALNYSFINDIDVDGSGNIFLTGKFRGIVDFDIGSGAHYLTTASGSGSDEDAFIMKLNNVGVFEWAYSFGSSNIDENGISVAVDALGNSFFSGSYYFTTIDFNPGPGVFEMTTLDESIYVLKFNSSGNFIWGKQIMPYPGPDPCTIYGAELKASKNGDLFITGEFYGDGLIDFDPNSGIDTSSTAIPYTQDGYIMKWTESGIFVWKKIQPAIGYLGDVYALSLTELNSGNIYETFTITYNFPLINLIELNNSGTLISNLVFEGGSVKGFIGSDQHDIIYISG
ncbi:MAG TPA: SBBP repeat-containing protein, partial [Bacteroidia bacterium]|nr:SBBP repeat-containing protein [Bacteroidia bacterium]